MALLSRVTDRRGRAPLSAVQVALAVSLLLALVAVAAAGHHNGSGAGSRPSRVFYDYLLSGFLVFMTVGAVALVYLLWQERDEGLGAPDPRARRRKSVGALVILTAVALALVLAREAGWRPRAPFVHHATVNRIVDGQKRAQPAKPSRPVQPQFRWLPAILVGGFFVAIVGLAAWAKARERVRAEDAREAAEEVAAALDESVDDLRAEPDPRRAIIAAYARMERALATVGVRRGPAEAPLEYLVRALEGLRASGVSVRRLTELFRVAKFSDHELGADDKERAIEALLTVRDELRAES